MPQIIQEFWINFRGNLFKPLLLFFYMGFLVPLLGVELEFPHIIYQGLTIFLLLAIGWKGGEELAHLNSTELGQAAGFMATGVITNFVIGCSAYMVLKVCTRLRRVDAATVAGYYGSDSAGTFATATGVLIAANILYAPYMPVMLAVMEIPGCLVALFLVSSLREKGMDALGNMPDEPGYDPNARPATAALKHGEQDGHAPPQLDLTLDPTTPAATERKKHRLISPQLLHEVFLNPGIYLLVGGILIGLISGLQGTKVVKDDDELFIKLFPGLLCLFLLEMGMTASSKLKDLKAAGWPFMAYALIAPNVYAVAGIAIAHGYSRATHQPMELGTYVLFAVLCGAASYIAVPAVQRLAIPEASPTLPLAASLGLTFSYNVTIGIPIYMGIAKAVIQADPVT